MESRHFRLFRLFYMFIDMTNNAGANRIACGTDSGLSKIPGQPETSVDEFLLKLRVAC